LYLADVEQLENEVLTRADIADALRGAGWDVLESASVESAIELLKAHSSSVVFFACPRSCFF
jgi:hypothetical protein